MLSLYRNPLQETVALRLKVKGELDQCLNKNPPFACKQTWFSEEGVEACGHVTGHVSKQVTTDTMMMTVE